MCRYRTNVVDKDPGHNNVYGDGKDAMTYHFIPLGYQDSISNFYFE